MAWVRGRVRALYRGGGSCISDAEGLRIVDVIVVFSSPLWCSVKCTKKSCCRLNVSLQSDPVKNCMSAQNAREEVNLLLIGHGSEI